MSEINKPLIHEKSVVIIFAIILIGGLLPIVRVYLEDAQIIQLGDSLGPMKFIGIDFTGVGSWVNPKVIHITVTNGTETLSFSFKDGDIFTTTIYNYQFTIYQVDSNLTLYVASGPDRSHMVSPFSQLKVVQQFSKES